MGRHGTIYPKPPAQADAHEVSGGRLSRAVAALVPDLGSPFHVMAFRGINDLLVAEGYDIL